MFRSFDGLGHQGHTLRRVTALIARHPIVTLAGTLLLALATLSCYRQPTEEPRAPTSPDPVKHGEYLVRTVGCEHCHTPGGIYGEPDPKRQLAGSDLGWKGPWGVRYPANLTPEMETGLGSWSEDDIVHAIRLAQRPDRTPIQVPMPWFHFVYFSEDDARAIARYLKTIPPVAHQVPERIAPGEKPTGAYIDVPPAPAWDAQHLQ